MAPKMEREKNDRHSHIYLYQGGYVLTGVRLFVCLLAGLRKSKILWKDGAWASEGTVRFAGNLDDIVLVEGYIYS